MPPKRKSSETDIYQIKITLLRTEIWRCMLVPADLFLDELHYVLVCDASRSRTDLSVVHRGQAR